MEGREGGSGGRKGGLGHKEGGLAGRTGLQEGGLGVKERVGELILWKGGKIRGLGGLIVREGRLAGKKVLLVRVAEKKVRRQ